MAKAITIQGARSNASKGPLTAALYRVLREDGYRMVSSRSQNMALNSAVTPDGLGIGETQVTQAGVTGIAPDVHMNPVLLKPNLGTGSQLMPCEKPARDYSTVEYRRKKKELFSEVLKAYHSLTAK